MRLARLLRLRSRSSEPKGCTCGHAANAHEHYRRGSDCAMCSCPRFRAGSAAKAREPRDTPDTRDPQDTRDTSSERARVA